jgi:peptidoglycan/LPS O-acetylase OafA/YrhL
MAFTEALKNQEQLTSTRSKPSRFYAPELDVVRFFAFVMVFGRHVLTSLGVDRHVRIMSQAAVPESASGLNASNLSPVLATIQSALGGLAFGVCLFFFISSYLITRLLLIEKERTGTVAIRDFYIRRSLRIWPLHFFFLALAVCLMYASPVFNLTWGRIVATSFFVANWAAVLHGWVISPIDLLWSVSVEEQFYLMWPRFAKSGRRGIVIISAILGLTSIATLIYLGRQPGVLNETVWANTFVQGLFFAAGAFAGIYLKPETFKISVVQRALLFFAAVASWVAAAARFHLQRAISPGSVELVAGYALVLAGTFLFFLAFANIKAKHLPSPLLYLGRISYGLYVFHVLALELALFASKRLLDALGFNGNSLLLSHSVAAVLALVMTIAAASTSYRFLEEPFLKLKERFTLVRSRPI